MKVHYVYRGQYVNILGEGDDEHIKVEKINGSTEVVPIDALYRSDEPVDWDEFRYTGGHVEDLGEHPENANYAIIFDEPTIVRHNNGEEVLAKRIFGIGVSSGKDHRLIGASYHGDDFWREDWTFDRDIDHELINLREQNLSSLDDEQQSLPTA